MSQGLKLNLFLLLVLLISIAAIWQIRKRTDLEAEPQNKFERGFLKINKDEIQEVDLNEGGRVNQLKKKGDLWLVFSSLEDRSGEEADLSKVNNLLDKLSKLDQVELVSLKQEKRDTFGLEPDRALKVKVIFNGSEKEFLVGKDNFFRKGTYLMFPQGNEIYLSRDILGIAFRNSDWRKKEEKKDSSSK